MFFLLAFISIPIIEIAVFISVGDLIGLWWTMAVVIATALGGAAALRNQGISVIYRAKAHLEKGRMPLREVFDGLCLLIAGALLLTPGFVTDIAGSLLFVPFIRTLLGHLLTRHIITSNRFQEKASAMRHSHAVDQGPETGKIIDGEFEEVEPESKKSVYDEHDNTRES